MERYTPFEEMDRMFEEMRTRVWGADPRRAGALARSGDGKSTRSTTVDLTEREGEFVLVADLPGFEKEEIDLSFEDGVVTIAAKHEVTGDEFARARSVSEYITLPRDVDEDGISATYRNGVLEVRFPVLAEDEDAESTKIEIR